MLKGLALKKCHYQSIWQLYSGGCWYRWRKPPYSKKTVDLLQCSLQALSHKCLSCIFQCPTSSWIFLIVWMNVINDDGSGTVNFPEHQISPPVFNGACVFAQIVIFCLVFCWPLFVLWVIALSSPSFGFLLVSSTLFWFIFRSNNAETKHLGER